MKLARRTFLYLVSAAFFCGIFGNAQAQDRSPQPASPPQANPSRPLASNPLRISPFDAIEKAASAMKAGDAYSVRGTVEALSNFPNGHRMPELMADVVKLHLINAQVAYLDGKTTGVTDGAVADAINALATAFDTPDYGRVSLLQVRFLRSSLAFRMPVFLQSALETRPDEPNPPMSPLQAVFVMSSLIDQKFANPDYQASPADWDRDFYPRLMEQRSAMQELQRRIDAGEVPPKYAARLVANSNNLENLVRQRIQAMSVADGLKLFNETFARLGIR